MTPMAIQDDWVRQTVRLPPDTHEALKALAAKNNRSTNAQLLEIVQAWVQQEGSTAGGSSREEEAVIEAVRRLSPARRRALLTLLLGTDT